MSLTALKMIYKNGKFDIPKLNLELYKDEYFKMELDLESDVFYELRVSNDRLPYKIKESSEKELIKIKDFFNHYKESFYFLFKNSELVGSILHIDNYIQCVCIAKKYQRSGYGALLTKFAINTILENGHNCVELNVFSDNIKAINLYKKLGFNIVE